MIKEIIEAIDNEDCEQLISIFEEFPEQKSAHTFFAGSTWLGYAAGEGKLRSVKALVEIGLDINQGCKRDNATPICNAAGSGALDVVEYLLNCGAQLNVSSSLENPLIWAVTDWENAEEIEIVKALLKAGIDISTKYQYKSKTKDKKDLDAIAKSLQNGTPTKAGVIAAWKAKGEEAQIKSLLLEAMDAADSHSANYNYGDEKLKEIAKIRTESLNKALQSALSVEF